MWVRGAGVATPRIDGMSTSTLRPFYDMWPQYNRRLREVIAAMSSDQLAIGARTDVEKLAVVSGQVMHALCGRDPP